MGYYLHTAPRRSPLPIIYFFASLPFTSQRCTNSEDRPAIMLWLAKRGFLLPSDSPMIPAKCEMGEVRGKQPRGGRSRREKFYEILAPVRDVTRFVTPYIVETHIYFK